MKQEHTKLTVGITGGIGSGKTTISKYFEALGVPVYYADDEAKALMNRSKVIKRKLIELFGENAFSDGVLNKTYLRQQIYSNKDLLQKMNAIVHPKVASHYKGWLKKQNTKYTIKEAAIIFENSLEHQYDFIITVVANQNERINRVMKRDGKTEKEVLAIINNQLSDEEKIKKSDFVIYNTTLEKAKKQVSKIHKSLLSTINSTKF